MNAASQTPRWLAEEEWLQKFLHWFVDRLDTPRNKAITRRVTETTVPALFKFSEETNYRWKLIEDLARDYSIFDINLDRVGRGQVVYDNAQLRLNPSCENLLRDWLSRPRIDPVQAAFNALTAQQGGRAKRSDTQKRSKLLSQLSEYRKLLEELDNAEPAGEAA